MLRIALPTLLLLWSCHSWAQVVYVPSGSSVYDFLDELANNRAIKLNTAVKPYARTLVANKLAGADTMRHLLTERQQGELDFYLRDFGKELHEDKNFDRRLDLFYFKNKDFTVTLNPIIGGEGLYNENGFGYKRTIGGEFWAYGSNKLGMYGSLRDNSATDLLNGPTHLVLPNGGNFKGDDLEGNVEWNEANGGITYAWKWGHVGLIKDRFVWGNNHHGANIFSGRQPTFAYLDLKMAPTEWFEFNYVHGWLVSEVVDSSRTYNSGHGDRYTYFDKFIASNLFSIRPVKNLWFSFGNSIVYSGSGANPVYFIPFLFFKSVDHTYNGTGSNAVGQNSQMFFDLSVRNIKNVHLYSTLFVDEVNLSNMFDPDEHTNMFSWKVGARTDNLGLKNVALTVEYTRTNPWTYRHEINTVTFESNNYNLGHYMRDNAQELYLELLYQPIARMDVRLAYTMAQNGPTVQYELINGVPNILGLEFLESIDAEMFTYSLMVSYEVVNDALVYFNLDLSEWNAKTAGLIPDYYRGDLATIKFGARVGL